MCVYIYIHTHICIGDSAVRLRRCPIFKKKKSEKVESLLKKKEKVRKQTDRQDSRVIDV